MHQGADESWPVMLRVRRNPSCCLRPITLGPWPYYRVSDLWSGPYLEEFSLNKRHLHHGCPTPANACCCRCHQGERFPTHQNPGRSEQSTSIWAPRLWCWIWSDGIVWVSFANHGLGSLGIDVLAARLRWVLQTGPSYLLPMSLPKIVTTRSCNDCLLYPHNIYCKRRPHLCASHEW